VAKHNHVSLSLSLSCWYFSHSCFSFCMPKYIARYCSFCWCIPHLLLINHTTASLLYLFLSSIFSFLSVCPRNFPITVCSVGVFQVTICPVDISVLITHLLSDIVLFIHRNSEDFPSIGNSFFFITLYITIPILLKKEKR